MTSIVPLVTPRLELRPLQPEDGPALLPLIQNWNVAQWLAVVPWPYTAEDMSFFIGNIAGPRAATRAPIVSILLGGTLPIGVAECDAVSPDEAASSDRFDLGFWIGEPYWGNGYMSEAVAALIARAFARPESALIRSGVFEGNAPSLRVHEKLGFEPAGTRTSVSRSRNAEVMTTVLHLTRDRFRGA